MENDLWQSGKTEEILPELLFERTVDVTVFSDFYCGVEIMDRFLHEGFATCISKECLKTYAVSYKGILVAMFALQPDVLVLDDDDKDEMRNEWIPKPEIALHDKTFLMQSSFEAVEIAYFAVEKSYRGQGLGRYIIEQITKKIMSEQPSCQFVTVGALTITGYSAVGFYEQCDFEPAEPPMGKETVRMYRVLKPKCLIC